MEEGMDDEEWKMVEWYPRRQIDVGVFRDEYRPPRYRACRPTLTVS